MNKKVASKGRLQLSRETLRSLTKQEMLGVAGATGGICAGGVVVIGPATDNPLNPCPNLGGGAANPSMDPDPNCPGIGPLPNPISIRFGGH